VRILLAAATAVTILAIALLVLLTPLWTGTALRLSSGDAALPAGQAQEITNETVVELFVGPGTFRHFSADEAAHMRDVRVVLLGFLAIAALAAVFLIVRLRTADAADWGAVALGGAGLAITVIALGLVGLVAFNLAFELFHRILFPGGNWAFSDDSLLIRLYPLAFWQLSSAALGFLAILGGMATWWLARRRAARLAA
jgi:hypothetical protein